MSANNSEPDKWKTKYLEALEQLEDKEHAWRRTDASLRHGLSRLALVSTGLNPGLDVQLKKLRRALQDQVKGDDLDDLVAKISEYLKTLDESGGVEPVADPDQAGLEVLRKIVTGVEFPPAYQSKLKRLRRGLNARAAEQRLEALVEEFTGLVVAAFYKDKQGGAQQGGWWRKIFAGGDTSASAAAAESRAEMRENEVAGTAPVAPAASQAAARHGIETLWLDFLGRLAVPAGFAPRVQALRKQLEAGLSAQAVGDLVKRMVGLVNDVQQQLEREKEALELFLDQLSQRLQALDAMVDGAESRRQASLASGRELDEIVQAEVNDIEQSVHSAADIGQMKGVIRGSLENIRRHLADKRQQEERRQSELEQQLKTLNYRLVEMEGESERLRARLAQERIQAMTDPLTCIANRLGYERRMEQEFARWQRYGNPLSMLVCDVDHFKRINDSYGHKAGDRALMAIAKSINQHVRQTDFVARVGGEEFVVLLPETALEAAKVVAEKLCQGVAGCEFVYEGTPVPITMSLGVAGFGPEDEIDDVYRRADKALYQAKEQGRNRIVSAT